MNMDSVKGIRISVIIPIKNRASLIAQTLESIIHQSLKPAEIILVDDGSTDALEIILTEYADDIIYLKSNGTGPGAARNTGLKVATGDFIKFFDSDDIMTPTSLQDQADALVRTDKKFVTSPYIYATMDNGIWKSGDNVILNYYSFPQTRPLQYWMIWGLFIPIPSMLFRKSFLDSIGIWPENIVTSEDWIYLWGLAQAEPFPAHTNTCAFIYRLHGSQSTGSNMDNLSRDKEKFRILQQAYEQSMRSEKYTWFDRWLFKSKFYQMARVTKDQEFKKALLQAASQGQWFISVYYRFKMKIGRNITQTDWQPMHGVSTDKKIITGFLKV